MVGYGYMGVIRVCVCGYGCGYWGDVCGYG